MRTTIAVAALLAVPAGTAAAATDFTDMAQVISATPITERVVEQRQECLPEAAAAPARERNVVAPVIGGVAGALLGSQIGRGSGRTAATAVGAVAGTLIGDRMANPDSDRPVTGAVVGGAAGGLLGAQVGSGSGRTAATAAGAIGGAMVGDHVQNSQTAAQPAQRCRMVETYRDVVRAYTVVYRYNGRDATTTLPYHPGNTVRVSVGVMDALAPGAPPPPAAYGPGTGREVITNSPPPPPGYGPTPVREVTTSTPPPPPPPYPYRY